MCTINEVGLYAAPQNKNPNNHQAIRQKLQHEQEGQLYPGMLGSWTVVGVEITAVLGDGRLPQRIKSPDHWWANKVDPQ